MSNLYACQHCDKLPSLDNCKRCKEVLKWEMAEVIQGMVKVYVHEGNIHNGGRSAIHHTDNDLMVYVIAHKRLKSVRKVAQELNTSKDTVNRRLLLAKERGLM